MWMMERKSYFVDDTWYAIYYNWYAVDFLSYIDTQWNNKCEEKIGMN
jgi:hypothetical protein